jgi:uncharacterized protein
VAHFSSHTPGTFSWVELSTTDQKAAVAFYRALFGWELDEHPMGPDEVYSMFRIGGEDVAGGSRMSAPERESGVPPHWKLYVTVASADEAANKAQSLGATVLAPPFDVMEMGRMAVLQDPTGAVFHVWQAKTQIGAKILNEPGALCWSELTTRDTHVAEAFYTALFGWTAKHSTPGGMEYTEFSNLGQPGVGMMAMPPHMPAHVPSFWMPYFQVADCDASAAKVAELGATVVVPAQDIPNTGRFAIVKDPQGAVFALFTFAAAPIGS